MFNAFIVDWTMDRYEELKTELTEAEFAFEHEEDTEHIRVAVPFNRVSAFGALCQKHLNSPINYVDIQYPVHKITAIIFQGAIHFITNQVENDQLKAWANAQGLTPEQAEWGISYDAVAASTSGWARK
jgi:hypothetical protein